MSYFLGRYKNRNRRSNQSNTNSNNTPPENNEADSANQITVTSIRTVANDTNSRIGWSSYPTNHDWHTNNFAQTGQPPLYESSVVVPKPPSYEETIIGNEVSPPGYVESESRTPSGNSNSGYQTDSSLPDYQTALRG